MLSLLQKGKIWWENVIFIKIVKNLNIQTIINDQSKFIIVEFNNYLDDYGRNICQTDHIIRIIYSIKTQYIQHKQYK